jgi:hypothetical protein
VTLGSYLRLRRKAAGLTLEQLAIGGTAALAIERDLRLPTAAELVELRASYRFDTHLLLAIVRGANPPICRFCGCSELDACVGARGIGCHWVERDLCSSCAERARPLPEGLAA